MMLLEGSCHCRAVRFRLRSAHPVPYQRCYCSICRKQQGGGGFAINLSGAADSLEIEGREAVTIYHAILRDPGEHDVSSDAERAFCNRCGSALWLFSPQWPELIHPFASAIDTRLPPAPRTTHMMVGSKADWVAVDAGPSDVCCDDYPDESIAEWHERNGLVAE